MTRRDNRQALTSLFQSYVDDYGAVEGEKIIRLIIQLMGGLRISVPQRSDNLGMRYYSESMKYITELWSCMNEVFGEKTGKEIMRSFMRDLGGLRLFFPDYDTLFREERNRKIRDQYNGSNHKELAIRFELHETRILRIARGDE